MKNKIYRWLSLVLAVNLILVGCGNQTNPKQGYKVVTTTTMLADLVKIIGGDQVQVEGLMGPGVDPHLYKASAGDVSKMQTADMVVFNGLHLEGKMTDLFENLTKRDKLVVEAAKGLKEADLIVVDDGGVHDPHIWFDVMLWKQVAAPVRDGLIQLDPSNKEQYTKNYEKYMAQLDELQGYILERINQVPETSRVLVTAHDAFSYFGRAYGFEVKGLQGISTASEAGTADVRDLAQFIADNQIKAIFVESSVPQKNIEALQEAVKAKGFQVEIGGELFSDSLGSAGTEAETYIGTVRSNVDTIVNALK